MQELLEGVDECLLSCIWQLRTCGTCTQQDRHGSGRNTQSDASCNQQATIAAQAAQCFQGPSLTAVAADGPHWLRRPRLCLLRRRVAIDRRVPAFVRQGRLTARGAAAATRDITPQPQVACQQDHLLARHAGRAAAPAAHRECTCDHIRCPERAEPAGNSARQSFQMYRHGLDVRTYPKTLAEETSLFRLPSVSYESDAVSTDAGEALRRWRFGWRLSSGVPSSVPSESSRNDSFRTTPRSLFGCEPGDVLLDARPTSKGGIFRAISTRGVRRGVTDPPLDLPLDILGAEGAQVSAACGTRRTLVPDRCDLN